MQPNSRPLFNTEKQTSFLLTIFTESPVDLVSEAAHPDLLSLTPLCANRTGPTYPKIPTIMKTRSPKTNRISRNFIAHLSRSLALSTLAIFGLGRTEAANFTWDPALDAGVTGGAGIWDITTANWYNGVTDIAWPNSVTDGAIFGGTGGGAVVITTGTGVTANALTFGVS